MSDQFKKYTKQVGVNGQALEVEIEVRVEDNRSLIERRVNK